MRLAIIFILLNTLGLYSQEDFQWIIKGGKGKNGVNNQQQNRFVLPEIGNYFNVSGVSHPEYDTPAANEFFFIYEDGSFRVNRVLKSDPLPSTMGYCFSNVVRPIYAYLTNIYEQDDPPQNVSVSGTSSSSCDSGVIKDFSNDLMFLNHDIVDYKDVTLVLNSTVVNSTISPSCGTDYKICYNVSGGISDGIELNPSSFDSSNGLYVDGANTLRNFSSSFSFDGDNCFSFQFNNRNTFFNFNSRILNEDIIGESVEFSLHCDGVEVGVSTKYSISSNFHDPNFVEVQCVWNDGSKNMVNYKVSCYNEGGSTVFPVSLSVGLPSIVDATTVSVLEWSINCNSECGSPLLLNSSLLNDNIVRVDFPAHLFLDKLSTGSMPDCDQTAWFTFCAELLPGPYNLSTVPLFVDSPYSLFDTKPYPITTFIDHFECSNEVFNECYKVRPKFDDCDKCVCCDSFWCRLKKIFYKTDKVNPNLGK